MRSPPPWERALVHAALIAACAATLAPALWVFDLALSPAGGRGSGGVAAGAGGRFSLENFATFIGTRDAAGRSLFLRQLANSLIVSGATAAIAVALSTSAAFALSRYDFPGRRASLRAFLVSQMFPPVVAAVPIYKLLDAIGLVDRLAGLVLVYAATAVPFSIWMLKGFFDQIPRELDEAARLEGASPSYVFWRIALPLASPGVAVTALFAFLQAWNEFILAATFLSAESRYTLPVVLQGYVGPYGARWGVFAAGSIVVSAQVIALFYALQKNMVRGLATGAVKG
jgi:arabinogalactan oligomer/maltooligosaccharide transport system permease protein